MNIGVISDTHIPYRAEALPDIVLQSFISVDYIIHAGDIANINVVQTLEKFAPVTAVAGNIDPPKLRELLGEKKLITLGGFTFGIVHGHGSKGKTIDRAAGAFNGNKADCIVFGPQPHTILRLHRKYAAFQSRLIPASLEVCCSEFDHNNQF